MATKTLPIPSFYDPNKADKVWPVPYMDRQNDALAWARQHNLQPASADKLRVALMIIDAQNSFCTPGYELVVMGAIDDNRRLAEFIYRNLGSITRIFPTLDTHTTMQIFHPIFLVDKNGNPVPPNTKVTFNDVKNGTWKVNPAVAHSLQDGNWNALQDHLKHYTGELTAKQKYDLTIWTYHARLGTPGHALVSTLDEAIFFYEIARSSQAEMMIKGSNPFTENYSIVGPEVTTMTGGIPIATRNDEFVKILLDHDIVYIAGQAKSHCVAWTIQDILNDILKSDPALAGKVRLLEDCTSPVVIPGVVDYTADADAAFARFKAAGMHVVRSTDPI